MTRGVRTALTLAVLCVLLAVAGLWGWKATTRPLPGKVDSPICVNTSVAAGDKVFPEQVTVSVYNAGEREGLAGRTMQLLTDAGFAEGNSGNASDGKVTDVAIWTDEPDNPAVLLVASHLGPDVEIDDRKAQGAGVTVVVGDDFTDLVKGRRAVTAAADSQICSPPVD
jgi:hypothetical protein